jgi:ankyrin repeat protein
MRRLLVIVVAGLFAFAVGVVVVSHLRREGPASTPLARAAQQGDAASVESLVARGEDVNARDAEGHTPLSYAARADDAKVINALLDAGADPNARDCNGFGWTPLINALHKYNDAAARRLVERGADVNARAGDCAATKIENGVTPLMFAAKFDNPEMVKFLLEHGADARAKHDGFTVLSYAFAGGSLGRLSDIDRAATHPCPVETVKLLLKAAPDVSLSEGMIDRAVLYVSRKKCPEVARLLEEHTSSPARDEHINQAAATQPVARN